MQPSLSSSSWAFQAACIDGGRQVRKNIELYIHGDKRMTVWLDQIAAVVEGDKSTYVWQVGQDEPLVSSESYDEVLDQIKEAEKKGTNVAFETR